MKTSGNATFSKSTVARRTGNLWEGRFHSCLCDRITLLACYRYIELNP